MPRLLTDNAIWRRLSFLHLYRPVTTTPGDTTLTADVAKGDATIDVTAITGFTEDDPAFLIGPAGFELISALGTPAVSAWPIKKQKLHFAHPTGTRLLEAVQIPLGRISQDGVGLGPSRSLTAIEAADRETAVAYIESALELSITFGLLEYDGLNWQLICGFVDDEIGTGTESDPLQSALGENDQPLLTNVALRFQGLRHDGKTIQVDALDCRFETSGTVQHNRQGAAILPATARFNRCIIRRW